LKFRTVGVLTFVSKINFRID